MGQLHHAVIDGNNNEGGGKSPAPYNLGAGFNPSSL